MMIDEINEVEETEEVYRNWWRRMNRKWEDQVWEVKDGRMEERRDEVERTSEAERTDSEEWTDRVGSDAAEDFI